MLIELINVRVLEVLEKQLSASPVWSVPSQPSQDGCSCMMPHGQLHDFTELPSCVPNIVPNMVVHVQRNPHVVCSSSQEVGVGEGEGRCGQDVGGMDGGSGKECG